MPTTASPLARTFGNICRALVLLVLLLPVTVVQRAEAQSTAGAGQADQHAAHAQHPHVESTSDVVQMKPPPNLTAQVVATATLFGSQEIPPADSDGSGTAQIQIKLATLEICATLTAQNLNTPNAAHIHRGAAGVEGDIAFNLPIPVSGSASACNTTNRSLINEIVANPAGFYVNIHTVDFLGGAIRGQLNLTRPTSLRAMMTGASPDPIGDPGGIGLASLTADLDTQQLCTVISVSNIDAPTDAHIHKDGVGTDDPAVVTLPVPASGSGSASGCLTVSPLGLLQEIVSHPSQYYVDVHNSEFPGGAIREQLEVAPATHIASLSGTAETPDPGDLNGTGVTILDVNVPAFRICVTTYVNNIETATLSHIHRGAVGNAGPIVVFLPVPAADDSVTGCASGVDPTLIAEISAFPERFYVNVHNTPFGNGAARGQMAPIATAPSLADVQITNTLASPSPVVVGKSLTYTMMARNIGPSPAGNVVLQDPLPAGVTFVSVTPNPVCSHASGTITCNLGPLGVSAFVPITVVVTPNVAGPLNNPVNVSTTTFDPQSGNNNVQIAATASSDGCTQRPSVQVTTQVVTVSGVPRLRATVRAQTSDIVPTNSFTSIQFTRLDMASINLLPSGPNNQTSPFTQALAGSPTQVQFDLFRTAAGTTATARFTVMDICGAWPSTIGAGTAVPI